MHFVFIVKLFHGCWEYFVWWMDPMVRSGLVFLCLLLVINLCALFERRILYYELRSFISCFVVPNLDVSMEKKRLKQAIIDRKSVV